MEKALSFARQNYDRHLDELREYLQIPSISTLAAHRSDVERAAAWIASHMERIGLQNVQVIPTDGHPFVYADWLQHERAPTVLLYGHYDCQPVDPRGAWSTEPFSAELREDRVYARGASDNKGQHFAHLKAFEAMLAVDQELPVNVKILLEGEEEVGSPNIDAFLTAHRKLLSADSGVISDGAMIGEGRPSIDYGLRGLVAMQIRVSGPARDLHSGSYGGTVLNPVQALSHILASLHDSNGKVSIPGFYDEVRPLADDERGLLAQAEYTVGQWRAETGASEPWGEPEYALVERIGARPTCEINGIWGGFQGEGMKTIIPASAGAKISARLVPDQDPDQIAASLRRHLLQAAPPQVQVEVDFLASCRPALMALDSAEILAARQACLMTWGIEPVLVRGGGSLPVVAAFQQTLGAPFVLIPFGLDDNRHSPDEHLRLAYFYKGTETAIRYYHLL